jgi:phospho-N-acetylmuramoyl-pentapeptide-transferase
VLYHLLPQLSDTFFGFNVFIYITVRAGGAAVTAVVLAFLVGPPIIRALRRRNVGQVVRADGPDTHHEKSGTPTMGGIIILLCTVVPTLLWARLDTRFTFIAIAATLWMGGIGFLDDYLKVVQRKPRGLVARYKLVGQISFGVALAAFLLLVPSETQSLRPNETTLPFFKYLSVVIPPVLFVVWVTFVMTAWSNAVNLTDGLDGLATGLTVIAAAAFAIFAYVVGNSRAAEYLLIYYLPNAGELCVFSASLMGATIGFLWFNSHPAEIIMGDTGSLGIGGALGTVSILLKSEFLLLLIGGVFVAETLSVLVQTSMFRWRKQRFGIEYARQHRVFRMAPLHHHFELKGWAESKVVIRFYILGILCALIGLIATLKFR